MNNIIFLIAGFGASVVFSLVVWRRHNKPRGTFSGIDDFQRDMGALSGMSPAMSSQQDRQLANKLSVPVFSDRQSKVETVQGYQPAPPKNHEEFLSREFDKESLYQNMETDFVEGDHATS